MSVRVYWVKWVAGDSVKVLAHDAEDAIHAAACLRAYACELASSEPRWTRNPSEWRARVHSVEQLHLIDGSSQTARDELAQELAAAAASVKLKA